MTTGKRQILSSIFKKIWKVNSGNHTPIMLTLVRREIMEQVLLEYVSGYKKEKVTGNSEHGSTKDISCPTNLLSFYDGTTGHVGEG